MPGTSQVQLEHVYEDANLVFLAADRSQDDTAHVPLMHTKKEDVKWHASSLTTHRETFGVPLAIVRRLGKEELPHSSRSVYGIDNLPEYLVHRLLRHSIEDADVNIRSLRGQHHLPSVTLHVAPRGGAEQRDKM